MELSVGAPRVIRRRIARIAGRCWVNLPYLGLKIQRGMEGWWLQLGRSLGHGGAGGCALGFLLGVSRVGRSCRLWSAYAEPARTCAGLTAFSVGRSSALPLHPRPLPPFPHPRPFEGHWCLSIMKGVRQAQEQQREADSSRRSQVLGSTLEFWDQITSFAEKSFPKPNWLLFSASLEISLRSPHSGEPSTVHRHAVLSAPSPQGPRFASTGPLAEGGRSEFELHSSGPTRVSLWGLIQEVSVQLPEGSGRSPPSCLQGSGGTQRGGPRRSFLYRYSP